VTYFRLKGEIDQILLTATASFLIKKIKYLSRSDHTTWKRVWWSIAAEVCCLL